MSEPAKAYLTKYVCATGRVLEISVKDCGDGYARRPGDWTTLKWGRDVFTTREAAVKDAHARREKKVASLKKQIAKLDAMKFA